MNRFSLMQQALLAWLIPAGFSSVSAEVDFAKEVLPVLSDKCFVCHGPDAYAYGDDMRRLDSFEASTAATDSGRAIDPKAPHKSLVIHRIHSTDDPMPPEDAEKQLTAAERELLTRWINEGGNYAKHWAFVPPV